MFFANTALCAIFATEIWRAYALDVCAIDE
jgi:hypothetical protein